MWITSCNAAVCVLEAFIFCQYCRNLFSSEYPEYMEAVFISVGYGVLFAVSAAGIPVLNLLIFFAVNLTYLIIMCRRSLLSALFHDLFITTSMMLSELCVCGIIYHMGAAFYGDLNYYKNSVICTVLSVLLYFLILQCTSTYLRRRFTRELYFSRNTMLINLIPLFSIFIAGVLMDVSTSLTLPLYMDVLISVSAVLLLAMNIFAAWFYTSTLDERQRFLEKQLIMQKEYDTAVYYDTLHQQDDRQKILIHDIRKHLTSIRELNEAGERDKITSYINQIIQSSGLQTNVRICDNALLNTILCRYRQQCSREGISLITDIRSGSADFLSEYDMTALFSNLLDNGAEAAAGIRDAFIDISVVPISESQVIITMVNACRKSPFSKDGIRLHTTKNDRTRHGYGMKSIQGVIKRYGGKSNYYYDEETRTFHSVLVLRRTKPGSGSDNGAKALLAHHNLIQR